MNPHHEPAADLEAKPPDQSPSSPIDQESRLDESRQQLIAQRKAANAARAVLKKERAEYEKRVSEVIKDLSNRRREVADLQQQSLDERKRLLVLHRRIKQRWHRRWVGERASMQKREAALQQEREAIDRARAGFNGQQEIERRRLLEQRQQLEAAEQAIAEKNAELGRSKAAVDAEFRALAQEKRTWRSLRDNLHREAEGLDSRVKNLRRRLQEEKPAGSSTLAISSAPIEEPTIPLIEGGDLQDLESLAQAVADQRAMVLEQCRRLALAEEQWQAEKQAALAELEQTAAALQDRESSIAAQEHALDQLEYELRERALKVQRERRLLEGWRSRLKVEQLSWSGERDRREAELRLAAAQPAFAGQNESEGAESPAALRQAIFALRNQQTKYERQIAQLTEEVERLARLLLEDDVEPELAKAA